MIRQRRQAAIARRRSGTSATTASSNNWPRQSSASSSATATGSASETSPNASHLLSPYPCFDRERLHGLTRIHSDDDNDNGHET
ncbi:unnamed protein product, partial [Anisakis simplex]|uniref:Uncharacterized protein n=1 Tax=Anisakis simplex TaxID=6269 RepID=A0A0M3KK56_ANISI